jgi:isocitrate/isopropylmalate dehydrogenase
LLHRPSAGDRRRTPVRLKPIEGTPTKTYKIAAIPGDGIGTEVVDAGVEVLKDLAKRETNSAFHFDHFDWVCEYYKKHGRMMPENGRDLIRHHDAMLFGSANTRKVTPSSTPSAPTTPGLAGAR